jgi:translation initiation factor IF-3
LLKRLADDITELGFVESSPKQDGRNMIMVVAPHRALKTAAELKGKPGRPSDSPDAADETASSDATAEAPQG